VANYVYQEPNFPPAFIKPPPTQMGPFEKINASDSRPIPWKVKNSTARLRAVKGTIKSMIRKSVGRSATTDQQISLPWVDPQERVNILRGRGPVLPLGDIGAPMINIPPHEAHIREKQALERHFAVQRKKSSQKTQAGAEASDQPSKTEAETSDNEYSDDSLLEYYLQDPAVPEEKTGRYFRGSDEDNFPTSNSRCDNPSHGALGCQTRRAAEDRRQVFAPPTQQSNLSEGCDLPDRLTRFDDLIAFGKRYGSRENCFGEG
jgi:hypothetical protein